MKIDKKTRRQIIEFIIIAGIVLWCVFNYTIFFHMVGYVIKLIMPLVVGLAIAFIINVLMKSIEKNVFKVDKRKNKKLIRESILLSRIDNNIMYQFTSNDIV